jgi:hypothetical protein
MAQWIEDPQGRPEVEKVTNEMKLPVWKANHKGKFRDFWNELWDKIEDYVVKLKGDTEKKSKGLNDRLVSAVGKHDGDFPITNAVVGNVYYSELTKKYYKCKIGGPAPMPNGNFIDLSILENLNRLENLFKVENKDVTSRVTNCKNAVLKKIKLDRLCIMQFTITSEATASINNKCTIYFDEPFKDIPFISITDNNTGASGATSPSVDWPTISQITVSNFEGAFTLMAIGYI